jgi:hypothetical protein
MVVYAGFHQACQAQEVLYIDTEYFLFVLFPLLVPVAEQHLSALHKAIRAYYM